MQSENKYPIQFPPAPQPDIVRACQKDDYFRKTLYEQYFDLAQYYLGIIAYSLDIIIRY